jgi:AraC-like DNA-binding protein
MFGFHRTEAAALGEIGMARVISTGHDVDLVDQDTVSLLLPMRGRIVSSTGPDEFQAGPRGALLFWSCRRSTRVEKDLAPLFLAPLFLAGVLRIPPRALRAAAERLDRPLAHRLEAAGLALSLDATRMRGVGLLTTDIHAMLAECDLPESLLADPRAAARAATQIVEMLVEVLDASDLLPHPAERAGPADLRRVRAAEDFMRANHAEIVSIGEVSRAIGVGARALQLAFGAVKGETPRATLAAIRLEAVRARLLDPSDGETVTNAALDCGLTHLGRFAAAYRARFGESPSATLRGARGG